jgi:hypothetical protein
VIPPSAPGNSGIGALGAIIGDGPQTRSRRRANFGANLMSNANIKQVESIDQPLEEEVVWSRFATLEDNSRLQAQAPRICPHAGGGQHDPQVLRLRPQVHQHAQGGLIHAVLGTHTPSR